jgi:hypothetical protein
MLSSFMTLAERKELRERTHLEIAMSAAVAAGLARNEAEARKNMDRIIEQHGLELKARWLRERGGGIKGWLCFLRSFGFEERLVVRRLDASSVKNSCTPVESSTFTE